MILKFLKIFRFRELFSLLVNLHIFARIVEKFKTKNCKIDLKFLKELPIFQKQREILNKTDFLYKMAIGSSNADSPNFRENFILIWILIHYENLKLVWEETMSFIWNYSLTPLETPEKSQYLNNLPSSMDLYPKHIFNYRNFDLGP